MNAARLQALAATPLVPSNVPLYKQLGHILREAILGNRVAVGEMLPTEQALIERYGVSRVTVRQALQELTADGLIRRQRPKGSVVVRNRPRAGSGWTFELLQDVVAFGEQTRVRIISFAESPAPAEVSRTFGFAYPVKLPRVYGLRLLKGEPLSEFTFWLTPTVASQLTRDDLTQPTLFSVIESRLGIRLCEADQTVWCEPAGKQLASLLRMRRSAPVLGIQRVYMAEGRMPVEVAVSRFRGDRYQLHHALRRM